MTDGGSRLESDGMPWPEAMMALPIRIAPDCRLFAAVYAAWPLRARAAPPSLPKFEYTSCRPAACWRDRSWSSSSFCAALICRIAQRLLLGQLLLLRQALLVCADAAPSSVAEPERLARIAGALAASPLLPPAGPAASQDHRG
jgi:hypothetical protein